MIWGSSLKPDPPESDPREEGWDEDKDTKTLRPKLFPKGPKAAPAAVLKSTRCSCEKSKCETRACSCAKANIPCSEFCGCQRSGFCNKWNESQEASDDEMDSDEDEEEEEEQQEEDD